MPVSWFLYALRSRTPPPASPPPGSRTPPAGASPAPRQESVSRRMTLPREAFDAEEDARCWIDDMISRWARMSALRRAEDPSLHRQHDLALY